MCAAISGFNPELTEEWLVTDSRGGFAMGTAAGVRTRKYHGFYLGLAGRAETAFLSDLELKLAGKALWPHRYSGVDAPVVYPDPLQAATAFAFERFKGLASWRWELAEGTLVFGIEAGQRGGIRLSWKWHGHSRDRQPLWLEIRPFWALRPLHGIGGQAWKLEIEESGAGRRAVIESAQGQKAFCLLAGPWQWAASPLWYRGFQYSEELARGYADREDLYSAGVLTIDLNQCQASGASWLVTDSASALEAQATASPPRIRPRAAALDFVLQEPAGICAGFPWFGEWGRDTFIALPGIALAWLHAGGAPAEVWGWAREILYRWGEWIRMTGMIPNLIEKGGNPQWESSDGTLWWCHALAALWTFSLDGSHWFEGIESEFIELLSIAIASIEAGRHRHLRKDGEGLLEVTEPHSTWMDARVDGVSVTPRTGRLPEINALWFQARCLHGIWARAVPGDGWLERLGRAALGCREDDRPNTVFLHSLPLAPSFVLRDTRALAGQLKELGGTLWTPVGLRTLNPLNPAYHPRCVGDQRARDLAYHQGPPWAWLGGHYQMARARLFRKTGVPEIKFFPGAAPWGAIPGHAAELFDAEPPHVPRGTPAQAWSVACFEEAAARRRARIDAKVMRILAQRWLEQMK